MSENATLKDLKDFVQKMPDLEDLFQKIPTQKVLKDFVQKMPENATLKTLEDLKILFKKYLEMLF